MSARFEWKLYHGCHEYSSVHFPSCNSMRYCGCCYSPDIFGVVRLILLYDIHVYASDLLRLQGSLRLCRSIRTSTGIHVDSWNVMLSQMRCWCFWQRFKFMRRSQRFNFRVIQQMNPFAVHTSCKIFSDDNMCPRFRSIPLYLAELANAPYAACLVVECVWFRDIGPKWCLICNTTMAGEAVFRGQNVQERVGWCSMLRSQIQSTNPNSKGSTRGQGLGPSEPMNFDIM